MSERVTGWIAWSVCGLILALIACAFVLASLNSYEGFVTFLIAEATAALVGGLIASRRPQNPVGWLILGHALCFTVGEFSRQYAIYGLITEPDALPLARAMAWPPYWIWYPGLMLMLAFLPLYFPNGRLVSRRWRPVVWFAAFVTAFAVVLSAVRPGVGETRSVPNPLGMEALDEVPRAFSVAFTLMSTAWLFLGAVAALSLVVRFRRSRDEERQQIKWVVFAVVLLISFTAVDLLFLRGLIPVALDEALFVLSLEALWVAIAVAVLRYRLYDIDRIINLTLVYGGLTGALVAVYVGSVVLLQYLFRVLGGAESQLAIVASTLIIAALFNPLRRRIQIFIDRRFYRGKYDARETLETFSAKLRDETNLDALSDDLLGVIHGTVQPEHASLWLRPLERRRWAS